MVDAGCRLHRDLRIPAQRFQALTGFIPFAPTQQLTQCAVGQRLEGGQTEPAGVDRAGQGHIEQAQILLQALLIRLGLGLAVLAQLQPASPILGMIEQLAVVAIHPTAVADEGQIDQWIFQPLGFVDGDHLHPFAVALQAQDTFIRALAAGQLFFQMAHQGQLAIQLDAGRLQQLRQVQQVGQYSLSVHGLQQAGW